MKWKEKVTVKKIRGSYKLQMESRQAEVDKADEYIVNAIEKGIYDEKELTQIVMKKEDASKVVANLRLAQFVLDYGDYISDDVGHMIIEP